MKHSFKRSLENLISALKATHATKRLDKESIKIFEVCLRQIDLEIKDSVDFIKGELPEYKLYAKKNKIEELQEARARVKDLIAACKERCKNTYWLSQKTISEDLRIRANAAYNIAKVIEGQSLDDKILHLASSDFSKV